MQHVSCIHVEGRLAMHDMGWGDPNGGMFCDSQSVLQQHALHACTCGMFLVMHVGCSGRALGSTRQHVDVIGRIWKCQ